MKRQLLVWPLLALGLGACKFKNEQNYEALSASGGAQIVDMSAVHEWLMNDINFRKAFGSIATSMGYGYYWGCPPDFPGWVRSATENIPGGDNGLGSYKVSFAPANAHSCPGDQPGLRATIQTLIVPWESMVVSAPKALPKGQPKVLASMTCEGSAIGACEIKRNVQVGYKTTTTNSRELSFGQDLSTAAKMEIAVQPFGVGAKGIFEVGFKASFGQKQGQSEAQENSRTETVEYRCPLNRDAAKGRTYVGRLISVPARVSVDYKVKVLLIPTLTLDGFPRISDDHGNHWLDHPTDRKLRQQQYGNAKLFFWREMDGYLNGGMMRKDANGEGQFSWADLKRIPEHEQMVRSQIGWLFGVENRLGGIGTGTATTEIDDVICQWTDTGSGQTKTVQAHRVGPGGGSHLQEGSKPAVPDWQDVPLEDEVQRLLESIPIEATET